MGGIDKRELHFSRERVRAEVAQCYRTAREVRWAYPHGGSRCAARRSTEELSSHGRPSNGLAAGEGLDTFEPPYVLENGLELIEELFDLQKAFKAAQGGESTYASSVHRWGPQEPNPS